MANQPPDLPLYRAIVEYDGSDLLGFQIQAEGRTVQGELERVLLRLCQDPVRVIGAGRTDSGVHARGQVIAFSAAWKHSLQDLHRALNALLPADIAVQSLELAPPGFRPRFSATKRWYRYQVGLWPHRSPIRSRYAWELGPGLDVQSMNAAAAHLAGEHDFASFGQPTQGIVTVRTVFSVLWHQQDLYLYFDIIANAFLRRMVRNVVGTLVEVGRGHRSPDDVFSLLERRDLSLSAPPAPPQGLFLMAVTYPDDTETGIDSRRLRSVA
ncbi:MAG: tRNA pseudouridine(38-40) synthase TruA [Chloroflexi bacterium]|nr:tRNA pseudouridine(38-40) synthase TruA [Chloroflexota bacterium]